MVNPSVMILIAGVFQGVCNFSFRQMSVATTSVYALAAFFVLSGVMFLGYASATRDVDLNAKGWMWVGAMCVTIFVANLLLMKGFGAGAPAGLGYLMFYITSLSTLMMLSMVVLGEKLNMYGWAGMVLAVVAMALMLNGKAV